MTPAFVITSLRNFFLLIPCTLLLAYLGVEWIWYMYPVTEGLTLAAFGLFRSVIVPKQNILDAGRRLRMTIYSEEEMGDVLGKVVAFCERWHAEPRQGNFVTMAVEEIAMAIFQKAIGQKGDGRIRVTLVAQTDGDFELHFIDNAVKFDPFSLKYNKMRIQKFEDFDINAVGMTIIRKKAKEFMYRQCQGFNSLIVRIGK